MQNVRLNIFVSKSDVLSYTIDISALLEYHTDFYSFSVFYTFALLYSGTEDKYLLEYHENFQNFKYVKELTKCNMN